MIKLKSQETLKGTYSRVSGVAQPCTQAPPSFPSITAMQSETGRGILYFPCTKTQWLLSASSLAKLKMKTQMGVAYTLQPLFSLDTVK